jgi:hypothetical protein
MKLCVYDYLVAEGIDFPPEAMNEILEEMYDEGLIRGPRYLDSEGRRLHGARDIIEPEWRRYEPRAPQ